MSTDPGCSDDLFDDDPITDWRDVPDEDQADEMCTAEELAQLDASRDAADAADLTWYTSQSADEANHDQETDLDAVGSPGGASWASVSPDGRPGYEGVWAWEVYSRWIDVDDEPDATLAGGEAAGEGQAKAAVAAWVRAALQPQSAEPKEDRKDRS